MTSRLHEFDSDDNRKVSDEDKDPKKSTMYQDHGTTKSLRINRTSANHTIIRTPMSRTRIKTTQVWQGLGPQRDSRDSDKD